AAAAPGAGAATAAAAGAAVRVGVSGWRYAPWRGHFYPAGLRQADELAFAASQLPTLEINGSFYALQTPASYAAWHDATPPGFVFSVKAPRYLTHVLKLRDIATASANFYASGLFALRAKLGPLLWQLPPWFRFDAALIEDFLAALPADTAAAQAIARRRDARMRGRTRLAIDAVRPMRHALEVRHASFVDARFIALLRRHRVALVVADTGGRWPELFDATADFVYLRLHGATELYKSRYDDLALARWAGRLRAWRDGETPAGVTRVCDDERAQARDVFCYFDNTDKLHAPDNARQLMQQVGSDTPPQTAQAPRRRTAVA
ncbi:MAG: DUF72 domain-containing protein, partial [Burkholderiaceae bacterium]|nr:DUF72 domain-containing protein [Burkholderiaceae bacterium]